MYGYLSYKSPDGYLSYKSSDGYLSYKSTDGYLSYKRTDGYLSYKRTNAPSSTSQEDCNDFKERNLQANSNGSSFLRDTMKELIYFSVKLSIFVAVG